MTQTFFFCSQAQIVVIDLAVRVSDKLPAAMFVVIAICSAFITFTAGEINK